jgi:SAM-dependent methyltransferase
MRSLEAAPTGDLGFVCPRCKGGLAIAASSYRCDGCAITYPVLFGIPDFRLRPDRYLSLEEEREKARRLFAFGQTASLEELVKYYYSITFDLPQNMVRRYQASILAGVERSRPILRGLKPRADADLLIDLGCGTGGLLRAAEGHYSAIYGVDIALRWLVIAQKRLGEQGTTAKLVCADVESLPFRADSFTQAIACDLVEHVYDIDSALREIARVLKGRGVLWLSAVNRYCVGPHPLAGIWGIGFLPARPRAWVLRRLKGIDLLRFANMVSPGDIRRRLRRFRFDVVEARPKQIEGVAVAAYSTSERGLIEFYRRAQRVALLRGILLRIGPAFELVCRKVG